MAKGLNSCKWLFALLLAVLIVFCIQKTSFAQELPADSINNDTLSQVTEAGQGKGGDEVTPKKKKRKKKHQEQIAVHGFTNLPSNQIDLNKNKPETDTSKIRKHSPGRAALMSTLLPGLGQVYNKKYWKLPIVYAGFGAIGYFIYNYADKYKSYKNSWYFKSGLDSTIVDPYPFENLYTVGQYKDFYRRNLELTSIIGGIFYLLNIVDAYVDGHMYDFDVTPDLTMRIEPVWNQGAHASVGTSAGVKLTLKF